MPDSDADSAELQTAPISELKLPPTFPEMPAALSNIDSFTDHVIDCHKDGPNQQTPQLDPSVLKDATVSLLKYYHRRGAKRSVRLEYRLALITAVAGALSTVAAALIMIIPHFFPVTPAIDARPTFDRVRNLLKYLDMLSPEQHESFLNSLTTKAVNTASGTAKTTELTTIFFHFDQGGADAQIKVQLYKLAKPVKDPKSPILFSAYSSTAKGYVRAYAIPSDQQEKAESQEIGGDWMVEVKQEEREFSHVAVVAYFDPIPFEKFKHEDEIRDWTTIETSDFAANSQLSRFIFAVKADEGTIEPRSSFRFLLRDGFIGMNDTGKLLPRDDKKGSLPTKLLKMVIEKSEKDFESQAANDEKLKFGVSRLQVLKKSLDSQDGWLADYDAPQVDEDAGYIFHKHYKVNPNGSK